MGGGRGRGALPPFVPTPIDTYFTHEARGEGWSRDPPPQTDASLATESKPPRVVALLAMGSAKAKPAPRRPPPPPPQPPPASSTCGFGGRDSREAPLVATEETPDDDSTASEDMEDYVKEALEEVEEIERRHRKEREEEKKDLRHDYSDAQSVMAQYGSGSDDSSDPGATQATQRRYRKQRQKLEDEKSQMLPEDDKSQGAKRALQRDA